MRSSFGALSALGALGRSEALLADDGGGYGGAREACESLGALYVLFAAIRFRSAVIDSSQLIRPFEG